MIFKTMQATQDLRFFLINFIFFFSGFLALAYQVLWSRFIQDFMGVSSYTYAAVLAAFMGGMALGSGFLGRKMDSKSNAFKIYAYLEIFIGLFAVAAFNPILEVLTNWYGSFYQPGWMGNSAAAVSLKFLSALTLLIFPTMLMGATFPAMVKITAQFKESIGRSAALCYGINAGGAVLGSLAMAFFILPGLGLQASLSLCGFCSGLLGFIAFLLSKNQDLPLAVTSHQEVRQDDGSTWLLLALIFLEGILGFSLEIAWTRYFALVFGSSTYSFATMLSALILGISIGSLALSYWDKKVNSALHAFGLSQVGMGASLLLSVWIYPYLPLVFKLLYSTLTPTTLGYQLYESFKFILAFILMFVPSFFGGMSLPLIVKAFARRHGEVASQSGLVYTWDTLGNVAGAMLGALFLLPMFGLNQIFLMVGLGCLILGYVSIGRAVQAEGVDFGKSVGLISICLVFCTPLWIQPWDLSLFAQSPHRRYNHELSWEKAKQQVNSEVLYAEDDPASSVMVVKTKKGQISLFNNGKPDASDGRDMVTQLLLGHVPLMTKPNAQDVLVIGMGSGVTAGAVLHHPVQSLKILELVEAVVKAEKFFHHVNFKPTKDPRTTVIVDDARAYLNFNSSSFDLIISAPSNPWQAGVGKLFTHEFYQLVSQRLRPQGLFVQWLQLYELSDSVFLSAIRTLRSVFPYLYGFRSKNDFLVLASLEAVNLDPKAISQRFQNPTLEEHLQAQGIAQPTSFFTLQSQTPQTMDALASMGSIINDADNLYLEHQAPRELFFAKYASLPKLFDDRIHDSPFLFKAIFAAKKAPLLVSDLRQELDELPVFNSDFLDLQRSVFYYEKTILEKKEFSIEELPPGFLLYSLEQLANSLNFLSQEKKWTEFKLILDRYDSILRLFLTRNPQLAEPWIKHIKTWIQSGATGPTFQMLFKILISLELSRGKVLTLIQERETKLKTLPPIFMTEVLALACQDSRVKRCQELKAKVATWGSNYTINSIHDFPRNIWSLPRQDGEGKAH